VCVCVSVSVHVWHQVQEELLLARSTAVAPDDVARLRRGLEQADAELQLVTSERDVLLERLKVSIRCRGNLQIPAISQAPDNNNNNNSMMRRVAGRVVVLDVQIFILFLVLNVKCGFWLDDSCTKCDIILVITCERVKFG